MKKLVFCVFLTLLSALSSYSQDMDGTSLKIKNHPRLFFPGKSFAELRKSSVMRSNPALASLHELMMYYAETEGMSEKPVPLSTAKRDMTLYVRKMAPRIFTAAYAFRITGNKAYYYQAIKNVELFIDVFREYQRGKMLDNSELWVGLGLAYDWLYPMLDKKTKDLILGALDEFGFDAVEGASFYRVAHNINSVCNSALVCAAIATYEAHPEKSMEIIRRSVESNKLALKGIYYPDGVSPEGPSYWDYASNYEAIMLMALEDNFGTDFGLSQSPGFDKGGLYRAFAVGNTGKWFNYADCMRGWAETCTALWYYAWKFGRKDLLFRDLERVSQPRYCKAGVLYMAIACAQRLGAFTAEYPDKLVYSGGGDAEVVIVRNGWDKMSAYLGLKGGKGEFNHSHLDEGSFVYEVDGLRWVDEFPHPKYSIYDKSKKDGTMTNVTRWERFIYNNRRHSTLTVNDRTMNPQAKAPVTAVIDEEGRRGGVLDLTAMYYDDLQSAVREAVILADGTLQVTDRIKARPDRGADIRWTLVTPAQVELKSDHVVLSQEGKSMIFSTSIPVTFRTWSANPADYSDSPFRVFEPDVSKDGTMCGFEFNIPAGSEVEIVSTIRR